MTIESITFKCNCTALCSSTNVFLLHPLIEAAPPAKAENCVYLMGNNCFFYFSRHCSGSFSYIYLFPTDDGTGPDKMALIMGPTDRCQHAASIITDLLQSVRAREEGGQVSICLHSVFMLS